MRLHYTALAFLAALGLSACDKQVSPSQIGTASSGLATGITSTQATVSQDANAGLAAANAILVAYEATKNPSQSVVTEAQKLLSAAQEAIATEGATSAAAALAVTAFSNYLLTSAPGNGVTPSTVPTT